ncbi:hypothetical protein L218DRAFT_1082345 [Marasmius fiardii PR-910]|nr:hypothetical protein L218DRAFT_1082345 [Marasmius fiardii PR-910]
MPSYSTLFTLCTVASGVFGAALANPLAARAKCSPNFEGAGISITGANGFVTPDGRGHGSPAPYWHVQQTGQPVAGYILRDIANNNRALTRNSDNTLTMGPASDSGTDVNQIFQIQCDTCVGGASTSPAGTLIASGCNIEWASDPSLCAQVGRPPSDDLYLLACGATTGGQTFSFST